MRQQLVVVNPEIKSQLINMIGEGDELDEVDLKFLESLSHSLMKLNLIQKFVLNRIDYLNRQNISLEPKVFLQYETEPVAVNLAKGLAEIKLNDDSVKVVKFTHLIAADGVSSATLALVNKGQDDASYKMIVKETPKKMQRLDNSYHLGVYMRLSRTDSEQLKLPEREFVSSYMANEDESYDLYFLQFDKKSHKNSDKKSVKVGFVGEVTKDFYDRYQFITSLINEKKKELTNESHEKNIVEINDVIKSLNQQKTELALVYAKQAVEKYLALTNDIDKSDLEVEIVASKKTLNKDRLKLLVFKGGGKLAEKAAIAVNNHGFYLLGDAYFSPNYHIAHGLNDGVQAAGLIGKIPKWPLNIFSGSLNNHISEYNELALFNANNAIERLHHLEVERPKYAKLGAVKFLEFGVEDFRKKSAKINFRSNQILNKNILNYISSIFTNNFTLDTLADQIKKMNDFILKYPKISKKYCIEIFSTLKNIKLQLDSLNSISHYNDEESVDSFNLLYNKMNTVVIKESQKIGPEERGEDLDGFRMSNASPFTFTKPNPLYDDEELGLPSFSNSNNETGFFTSLLLFTTPVNPIASKDLPRNRQRL